MLVRSASCRRVACAAALAWLGACTKPRPPQDDRSGWLAASARPSATAVVPAVTASAPQPPPTAAPPAAFGVAEGSSFPPPNVAPPEPNTAEPGDGVWRPLQDGMKGDRPFVYRMRLHDHRFRHDKYVDVIAFDRLAVELTLVPGRDEPPSKTIPGTRRLAMIPPADYGALIAAFNGGFLAKHGHFGMMQGGDVYLPPLPSACTILHGKDASLRIGTWTALDASAADWWRQTPPCLVESGAVNPALAGEPHTLVWGKAVGGASEIRRSALGLDRSRRALFYAFGEWHTAAELAGTIQLAGAFDAAELDVNWSYTKFFLFDHPAGRPPEIRETIMPKLPFDKKKYVERAEARDFFYVKLRDNLSQ